MIAFGAVAALAATHTGVAGATSVTINKVNGTVMSTTGLTGFATNGAQMAGMSIQVNFSNSTSETGIWATTGAVSGAASGTGWSVAESGDTFLSTWTLRNTSGLGIDSVVFNGGIGDTLFDTTFGGLFGTAGSARGLDFAVVSGLTGLDIAATYSEAVAIGAAAPVGDIFNTLTVDFSTLGVAFGTGRSLVFRQDTDNLKFAGDLNVVPLPTAAMLGVFGLSVIARRRRF